MRTRLLWAAVIVATGLGCKGGAASADRAPAGGNAVQNEMRLLDEAMRDAVTAVAYGRLDAIPEKLHGVHHARERTEEAIEKGEYKLARNADKLPAFKELDEQFHAELEKLAATAKSKDAAATGLEIGVVLSKCSGCHEQFKP